MLKAAQDRKGGDLTVIMNSEAGKKLGVKYAAVSTYVKGQRVPKDAAVQQRLMDLFELSDEERRIFDEDANADGGGNSLEGVSATDLGLYSFLDIEWQFFAPGREAPVQAVVFVTVPPLAAHNQMVSEWAVKYLAEPGRELIYVTPPGRGLARLLKANLGKRLQEGKSSLLAVVSCAMPPLESGKVADATELQIKREEAYHEYAKLPPPPRVFDAFELGQVHFALTMPDGGTICFTTMPINSDTLQRIRRKTLPSHPSALWVLLDAHGESKILTDIEILNAMLRKWKQKHPSRSAGVHEIDLGAILDDPTT
jgi:hypothetical protein